MISVTVSSASSRSSGPWPSMSSAISAASRSRSSREMPASLEPGARGCRRSRARAAPPASMLALKSCGPSSPITREVDAVLDLREGSARGAAIAGRRRPRGARAVPSRPSSAQPPAAARGRGRRRAPLPARSCRRARGRPCAASRRGRASTIGAPSLTERGMSRSLGTSTSGVAAEDRRDVLARDADVGVRAVEHELDALAVVAHQLERLEAELRVLQRQRVEHPDHAHVRRARRSTRSPRA